MISSDPHEWPPWMKIALPPKEVPHGSRQQDPAFKRSGEARPGKSAPALVNRERAGMIRRTEAIAARPARKHGSEASAS